jgi:hypothetical protein
MVKGLLPLQCERQKIIGFLDENKKMEIYLCKF